MATYEQILDWAEFQTKRHYELRARDDSEEVTAVFAGWLEEQGEAIATFHVQGVFGLARAFRESEWCAYRIGP